MNYHIDFELFSRADLPSVGAYRYAEDPSTELMMFSISTDTEGPFLWINPKWRHILPSDPRADRLVNAIKPDDLLWAHYATFEVACTRYQWRTTLGLPPAPKLHQWRCTALLGRCAAMPAKLERLAEALGLVERKDPRGAALIRLLCIPQKDGSRTMPDKAVVAFKQLGEYCLQDNRTERAIHTKLLPFQLRGPLLDAWLFDLRMNDRGFPVNVDALRHAQKIIREASTVVVDEFRKLTGLNPTQNKAMKEFLAKKGLDMADLQADTVEAKLEELDKKHPAYAALDLYSKVQFAAVKKVQSMLDCVCSDGWIRGMLLFYGAGTGRWSGRGVQPQNFKRPTIKGDVYAMIQAGRSLEDLEFVYGNALDALSSCIRNFIQPPDGKLLDADYNAVEARIVCWLASQLDRLSDWERGVDQYKMMAGVIYGRPTESIINPSDEREVGKRTILGCGFGMGAKKFKLTLKKQYGIEVSLELARKAVDAYRRTHDQVQRLWWATQRAAQNAIKHPGEIYKAGEHLRFWCSTINGIPFLFMRLPSGRKIAYPWPKLELQPDFEDSYEITFGAPGDRTKTYGAKLVENATQGVAADLMMSGACKAESRGAEIIMLVHDQSIALDTMPLKTYTEMLVYLPDWAIGLPIKAEGKIVPFYKK